MSNTITGPKKMQTVLGLTFREKGRTIYGILKMRDPENATGPGNLMSYSKVKIEVDGVTIYAKDCSKCIVPMDAVKKIQKGAKMTVWLT